MTDQDKQIAELKARIEKLEAKPKTLKTEPSVIHRPDHPQPGGGWIVRTPVEDYTGVTCKIQFTNGLAVVDEDHKDADRIVHMLEHDFHYSVESVGAEQVAQARKIMAQGAKETTKTLGEKLAQPQMMK